MKPKPQTSAGRVPPPRPPKITARDCEDAPEPPPPPKKQIRLPPLREPLKSVPMRDYTPEEMERWKKFKPDRTFVKTHEELRAYAITKKYLLLKRDKPYKLIDVDGERVTKQFNTLAEVEQFLNSIDS